MSRTGLLASRYPLTAEYDVTRKPAIVDKRVMTSSCTPSAKYWRSAAGLKSANGSTATPTARPRPPVDGGRSASATTITATSAAAMPSASGSQRRGACRPPRATASGAAAGAAVWSGAATVEMLDAGVAGTVAGGGAGSREGSTGGAAPWDAERTDATTR